MNAEKRPLRKDTDAFVSRALQSNTDDCIEWPFARNSNGYAVLTHSLVSALVARQICRKVYGPAPSSRHQAAHSCGRGQHGCINPRHIRWATPKENSADKYAHGTMLMGSAAPWAKLTDVEVFEIKLLILQDEMSQYEIGAMFDASEDTIGGIARGETWRSVPWPNQPSAERMYPLTEVTHCLGEALKRVNRHDLLTFERPFNLFLDDVVRILKEPPRPAEEPIPDAEQWNKLLDFASPND